MFPTIGKKFRQITSGNTVLVTRTTGIRVQVLDRETGARQWVNQSEFSATFRPVVTLEPSEGAL